MLRTDPRQILDLAPINIQYVQIKQCCGPGTSKNEIADQLQLQCNVKKKSVTGIIYRMYQSARDDCVKMCQGQKYR